jgi:hypothetical protein
MGSGEGGLQGGGSRRGVGGRGGSETHGIGSIAMCGRSTRALPSSMCTGDEHAEDGS